MERVYIPKRMYANEHTSILPIQATIGKGKVSHRQIDLGVSGL